MEDEYKNVKNQLNSFGYTVVEEVKHVPVDVRIDVYVIIKIMQGYTDAGIISFYRTIDSIGELGIRYNRGDKAVCFINSLEVYDGFKGQQLGYYLMLLALLYTRQNLVHIEDEKEDWSDITHVKLNDCSDRSGEVPGNLYFNAGMTPINPIELKYSNQNTNTVPLSKKRGSLHIEQCDVEKVGVLNEMIGKIQQGLIKRSKKSKKSKGGIRKSRQKKNTKKSKKTKTNKRNIRNII
jgi:hypothetical protein